MYTMILSQPQVGWLFQMYDANLAALAITEAYAMVYDHMGAAEWAPYGEGNTRALAMDRVQVLDFLAEMDSTASLAYKEDCQCSNGTYICPSCRGNLDMEGWFLDAICHVLTYMVFYPELTVRWLTAAKVDVVAVDPATVTVTFHEKWAMNQGVIYAESCY